MTALQYLDIGMVIALTDLQNSKGRYDIPLWLGVAAVAVFVAAWPAFFLRRMFKQLEPASRE